MRGLFNKPNGCVWELGEDKLTQQEEGKGFLVGFGLFGRFLSWFWFLDGMFFGTDLGWVGSDGKTSVVRCAGCWLW
jgi:hypothetical protein